MNNSVGGETTKQANDILCPACGMKLVHQGGCPWCPHCFWSQCG